MQKSFVFYFYLLDYYITLNTGFLVTNLAQIKFSFTMPSIYTVLK